MVALEIEKGGIVRNNRPSAPKPQVGRVLELSAHNAQVKFWHSSETVPKVSLELLPGNAPEARLWTDPGSLVPWVKEAPLKLLATALSVSGNRGNVADIRGKLENLDGWKPDDDEWKTWWQSTQRKLKKSEGHFDVVKDGKDILYILKSNVDDVPVDTPKPTKARAKKPDSLPEWQDWFLCEWDKEPPESYPKKAIIDALAKWPKDTIEPTLKQAIRGAEGFLASKKPTPQATLGWLEAVGQASRRWWECTVPYPDRYLSGQCSEVLLKLAKSAGYAKSGEWLLWAHALSGQADESWMQGFAAGMWAVIGEGSGNASRNRRNLFRVTSEMLGRQSRADLAREIALAAFRDTDVSPRYSELDELDQILEQLTPGEEAKRLLELIALSSEAAPRDKNRLLDYIANSRYATGPERLNLLVLATLLLTDGKGPVAAQASRELDGILARLDNHIPAAQALFRDARARIEGEVTKTVDSYDRLLEHQMQERKRLHGLLSKSNKELEANRKQSRLEIRQDMLLAVGEVLQTVMRRQASSIDELAGKVEAGLTLALKAGEAELLNTAPEGKVVAPGVQVRGIIRDKNEEDGFKEVVKVLLKPQVKQEVG